ncbi:hypothetical protein GCM10011409_45900 [Lentibacillus populi]|uniref:DUF3797 domain-containing protein n=1 Tax=Lentibacillus populi TaxID=1827502 RepID=A0A9W5X7P2_9BACI|nr:DUF3797 domain-containing protein [Lentibacillus populi]MBT2215857.1 DUF3797 domain-containing protein [Virgibacillus dakarensis]MBT2215929.1 DUF3797 domain-containing protein [Virgibacillus dakarensis]GGB63664.1 hypothetical protein GCM10011409_45900 [Lentibacillus populi]
MNALKAAVLLTKYAECPKCGNSKVGNGEGTCEVEEGYFYRTCKCGYEVKINEENTGGNEKNGQ